jgi:hypothetical protein
MSDLQTRLLERQQDNPLARLALVRQLMREGSTQSEAWCRVYGFSSEDIGERESISDNPRIRINGELFAVTETRAIGYGDLVEIETWEGETFILSESSENAGLAARERWEDMARNDRSEFACMVGEETLVSWALGEYAGPGSTKVTSLSEWLDLWLDTPFEEWASYDSEEREVERVGKLVNDLGFKPGVAYRTN